MGHCIELYIYERHHTDDLLGLHHRPELVERCISRVELQSIEVIYLQDETQNDIAHYGRFGTTRNRISSCCDLLLRRPELDLSRNEVGVCPLLLKVTPELISKESIRLHEDDQRVVLSHALEVSYLLTSYAETYFASSNSS